MRKVCVIIVSLLYADRNTKMNVYDAWTMDDTPLATVHAPRGFHVPEWFHSQFIDEETLSKLWSKSRIPRENIYTYIVPFSQRQPGRWSIAILDISGTSYLFRMSALNDANGARWKLARRTWMGIKFILLLPLPWNCTITYWNRYSSSNKWSEPSLLECSNVVMTLIRYYRFLVICFMHCCSFSISYDIFYASIVGLD